MRVDVSEIKTYQSCPRKWQFSSRNAMHLAPVVTPRHFTFGTIFHEALHQLYLGADSQKVLEWVRAQIDPETPSELALPSMVQGYVDNLLSKDLGRYQILEIEHHFERIIANPHSDDPIKLCGSIDMVVLERPTAPDSAPLLWGFEHKTCKNFRSGAYAALDDQPRVYNWELYNLCGKLIDSCRIPADTKVGGIIINETRKLLRKFENKRTAHSESRASLWRYIDKLAFVATRMQSHSKYFNQDSEIHQLDPCADYMSCQMCEFATICEQYGIELPQAHEILTEFAQEFVPRDYDHLDEKVEREVLN